MTVPYNVNEHQSDIGAIKPGWYGMENKSLIRAVLKPGDMPHRTLGASPSAVIALVAADH